MHLTEQLRQILDYPGEKHGEGITSHIDIRPVCIFCFTADYA